MLPEACSAAENDLLFSNLKLLAFHIAICLTKMWSR